MSCNDMLDRAMVLLSQGSCSELALYRCLEEEFANEPNVHNHIKETLSRLHQLNLINDARIARQIAEHLSHKGDAVIIQRLHSLGINECHLNSALASIGNEYERALRAAQMERLAWNDKPLPELQTKIMRLLSSRSFTYHTLCLVMDTLFNQQSFNYLWKHKSSNLCDSIVNTMSPIVW